LCPRTEAADAVPGHRRALMDHLWAPWRREFIDAPRVEGCIFCVLPAQTGAEADRKNLILGRSARSFAILNRFPYNNGHLMVVPQPPHGRLPGTGARGAGGSPPPAADLAGGGG